MRVLRSWIGVGKRMRDPGPEDLYSSQFFDQQVEGALASARVCVPLILDLCGPVGSVVDFGCARGAWLKVFIEHGVDDVLGLDAMDAGPRPLLVPQQLFRVADLSSRVVVERRFDLAICLEVAEHLPEESAGVLVGSLTECADRVVFSAAVPLQGGTHHVNEQWPDYWESLFALRGFRMVDCFRGPLWDITSVEAWYRQNMFLYVPAGEPCCATAGPSGDSGLPLRMIHPELWLQAQRRRRRGRSS